MVIFHSKLLVYQRVIDIQSINLTVLETLDADGAGAHEGTAGIQSTLGPEGRRSGRTKQCQCQPFHGHRDTTSNMTTSDKKTLLAGVSTIFHFSLLLEPQFFV